MEEYIQRFDDGRIVIPCLDCSVDTLEAKPEHYMIQDELWSAVSSAFHGFMCIGCVETKLQRKLTPADFMDLPVNSLDWHRQGCPGEDGEVCMCRSSRLQDRLTK
jgi:hypothetical protein